MSKKLKARKDLKETATRLINQKPQKDDLVNGNQNSNFRNRNNSFNENDDRRQNSNFRNRNNDENEESERPPRSDFKFKNRKQ